jgi:hypothetical protein
MRGWYLRLCTWLYVTALYGLPDEVMHDASAL